jgi:hypothetical protein
VTDEIERLKEIKVHKVFKNKKLGDLSFKNDEFMKEDSSEEISVDHPDKFFSDLMIIKNDTIFRQENV